MKIEIVKMKIALQQERAEREELEGEFVCIVEPPEEDRALQLRAIFGLKGCHKSHTDAEVMLTALNGVGVTDVEILGALVRAEISGLLDAARGMINLAEHFNARANSLSASYQECRGSQPQPAG